MGATWLGITGSPGSVHLNNRYYALVGLDGVQPTFNGKDTFHPCATTYIADSPFGPFLLSEKNTRILVGNASYFARFITTPDGVLVNHHSWETDPGLPFEID